MAFDPYNRTGEISEAALTAMADRLESRGRDPAFLAMLDDYLGAMDAGRLSLVLDVGCGTGVVARRLARLGAFAGRIVGIDRSPDLMAVARQQAASEGLADRIEDESDYWDLISDLNTDDNLLGHPRPIHGDVLRKKNMRHLLALCEAPHNGWPNLYFTISAEDLKRHRFDRAKLRIDHS